MKYLILLGLLASCQPSGNEKKAYTVLPEGLKDCKVYQISDGFTLLYVVRCPNSQTSVTYNCGKSCKRTVSTIETNQ